MNKYELKSINTIARIILLFTLIYLPKINAQELGYLSGLTKQGINPQRFEPLYGFTIGAKLNKILYLETAFYYSQRSNQDVIQADYFSFLAMPKIGYFTTKFGVFYAPGISLNPTLYHSNAENHTYLATLQTIGGQFNLSPHLILDLKLGYDIGLTYGHFENGIYTKYSGPIVLIGIKYSQTIK